MPDATLSGVCSIRLSGPKKKYQSPKMNASLQQSTTPISKTRRGRDLPFEFALLMSAVEVLMDEER